jgi:hypothetical protein
MQDGSDKTLVQLRDEMLAEEKAGERSPTERRDAVTLRPDCTTSGAPRPTAGDALEVARARNRARRAADFALVEFSGLSLGAVRRLAPAERERLLGKIAEIEEGS